MFNLYVVLNCYNLYVRMKCLNLYVCFYCCKSGCDNRSLIRPSMSPFAIRTHTHREDTHIQNRPGGVSGRSALPLIMWGL